jgi:hypothetical protein
MLSWSVMVEDFQLLISTADHADTADKIDGLLTMKVIREICSIREIRGPNQK